MKATVAIKDKKVVDNPTDLQYSIKVGCDKCDSGVVGNARPCQGRDRGFEPRLSLQINEKRTSYGCSLFR